MARLMRCQYCGTLQDEPAGAKACIRCGGELAFAPDPGPDEQGSYVLVQMELDQVMAPAGRGVERHLLVTLRTPVQVPADQAARTGAGRPPLSLTAVLDVSGSMSGDKLAHAKDAVRQALARLHDGDTVSLVTFGSEVRRVLAPAEVGDQARRVVSSVLQEITAGGMTALCGGLDLGIEQALAAGRDTNLVLLLSDGQANIGETDIEKVGFRAFGARQRGAIVSTLGVGYDYNEALMVEIATQGGGRFYHVQQAGQIGIYLTGELGEVAALAARDTRIQLVVPGGAILVPFSAAYPASQDGSRATVTVGDIPSDTELEVPIRATLSGQHQGAKLSFEGFVTYLSPAGNPLKSALNRVTLRFLEPPQFQSRDGAIVPVVERVLEHMKAANVLGAARAMAGAPTRAGAARAETSVAGLREYAALLGEERADQEAELATRGLEAMRCAPVGAKVAVAAAFTRSRSTKRFDQKDN